ncbi:hypothetical protein Bca52824_092834 [Brassica carinata]|uniref:Uncharacterized protein n=1 Tax=Brassica carinata TaxID=52824 RepID=A0A8X7TKF1_BRACI|nr:hypothetical protein Bca52824_092834 [Brassica carinata]
MSNSRAATTVNTWSGFTFMLPLFSAPFADSYWDRFFTILASSSLYFVVSVLNPSLQAFGADQLDHDLDHPPRTSPQVEPKSQFSNGGTFVSAGSLLGVTTHGLYPRYIWSLGFAIPTFHVLLIFLFLCGSGFMLQEKPYATVATLDPVLQARPQLMKKLREQFLRPRNREAIASSLPIWTMLLTFAVIFQQPATFFTKQGMAMKRNIGPNFKIPPATLQSTITLSIILLMPLYDKVLIPMAKKITKTKRVSLISRKKRLKISQKMKTSPNFSDPLSIFLALPQYILLGVSDIFTVVGMQEFFYSEVPVRMRTMGFALYTSVFVGSFVSAALISAIESYTSSRGRKHNWFADDMSEARLDNYYWLLAITSAISF